ncbi:HlyD family secretion protein [Actibacterium sp. D379-3]
MKKHIKRHFPTFLALFLGVAGIVIVLYAWQLPPFRNTVATTENAYVRGRITSISPQLSGYVADVPVTDFQEVEAGQVLVRLDDRQYRQRLAQAVATVQAARAALDNSEQESHSATASLHLREAALDSAQAALASAQSDWKRVTELQERGVISVSSADKTELALRQAESQVSQAQSQIEVAREALKSVEVQRQSLLAGVASAEAAVELARIDLENTVIRAPEAGRLGQIGTRVGQYVSAGSALMSHVAQDIWIIANFKETQLHGMTVGQPVTFTVDALQDRAFTGHIEHFAPATASEFSLLSGSNATGNFTKIAQRLSVRIEIDPDQPQREVLAPGLSVVVHIDTAYADR